MQKQQEQEKQREEALQKLLSPEAFQRIKTIELVKPDKVHASSARDGEAARWTRARAAHGLPNREPT